MAEIMVGVDGSETAAAALRWAAQEATWRNEPLVGLLAWGFLFQHHAEPGAEFDPEYVEADARAALETYARATLGEGAAIDLRTICDIPWRALVNAAAEASMLVVGARGLGGFKGLLLGSVSHQCLHHAMCPVAIVREPPSELEPHEPRIVVGVDGSPTSATALRWAVEEGERRGAVVDAVHAWQLPFTGPYPYMSPGDDPNRYEDNARLLLDEEVDRLRAKALPNKVLALGGPASVILDAAQGADLVVVGSRGVNALERFLLGSTSTQVVHHAPCPVVVIPTGWSPR